MRWLIQALGDEEPTGDRRRLLVIALLEIACLTALFFLYASHPPPNVNEAHYLAKAKHYWSPDWLAGDHFLESSDAHLVFYWAFGWLTLWFPLPVVAWIGRFITWIGLAIAFRRLSRALSPRPFYSVLAGALFVVLLDQFHMAGEWLIGGVEAKGFAFIFVFLALDCFARGRSAWAMMLAGVGAAFHVLVGGWAMIALVVAWLLLGKDRSSVIRFGLAATAGFLFALPGLIPGVLLTRGTAPEIVTSANHIYVYERLSHHLVPSLFPTTNAFGYEWMSWAILRFLGLAVVWFVWWRFCWTTTRTSAIQKFTAGACLIAAAGFIINAATFNTPDLGAKLLRLYWFRLSDFAVPLGAAFLISETLLGKQTSEVRERVTVGLRYALIAYLVFFFGNSIVARVTDPRPLAQQQSLAGDHLSRSEKLATSQAWRDAADWIRTNTPTDARFITPRAQQSFKWSAHRSEIVNWKDVPQNAAALVEWSDRMAEVYPADWDLYGMTVHTDDDLIDLADKYDADFLLLYRPHFRRPPDFPKVYPADRTEGLYEVYAIPRDRKR